MEMRRNTGQETPADMAEARRECAGDASRTRAGYRLLVGADGRTRAAKRWKELFTEYMEATGSRQECLCRQLATLTVQREQLDADVAAGKPVDVDVLLRLSSEVRRTLARLGLIDADEPAIDGTQAAIAALHAQRAEAV